LTQPDPAQPTAGQPVSPQPASDQPATPQPASARPVTDQPNSAQANSGQPDPTPTDFTPTHCVPPRPPDLVGQPRHDLPLPLPPGVPLRAQRFFQRPIRLDPAEKVQIRLTCHPAPQRIFLDEQPLAFHPLADTNPTSYLAPLPNGLTGRHLLTVDFAPVASAGEQPLELQGVWLEFLGVEGTGVTA